MIDWWVLGCLLEFCVNRDVWLLVYGILCGGFLFECWLGKVELENIFDWLKMKYKCFIDVVGGWGGF